MPDNLLYYGDPGAPGPRRHEKDESVDFHDEYDAKSATKKIIISVKGIEYPPVWHELTFKMAPKASGKQGINKKTLGFCTGDE